MNAQVVAAGVALGLVVLGIPLLGLVGINLSQSMRLDTYVFQADVRCRAGHQRLLLGLPWEVGS